MCGIGLSDPTICSQPYKETGSEPFCDEPKGHRGPHGCFALDAAWWDTLEQIQVKVQEAAEHDDLDMEYRDYRLRLWVDSKCISDKDLETMFEKLGGIYEAYVNRQPCKAEHSVGQLCDSQTGGR